MFWRAYPKRRLKSANRLALKESSGISSGKRGKLMDFQFVHNNFNVLDLQKSLEFYEQALGLKEVRRINAADGSFTIVYLGDGKTAHQLELTWLKDWERPYDLGDNEFHLALSVDDYNAALAKHKQMGCVCFENADMGIYFIEDPDGYWIEIVPAK